MLSEMCCPRESTTPTIPSAAESARRGRSGDVLGLYLTVTGNLALKAPYCALCKKVQSTTLVVASSRAGGAKVEVVGIGRAGVL